MVCKVWPAHDGLLLVAVPLIDSAKSGDGKHFGDIELLVVDRNSLQIRQRLLQPGLMNDDAIAIDTIEFDTGRYGLAPVSPPSACVSRWQTIRSPIPSKKPTCGSTLSQAMRCARCSTALSLPAIMAKATPIAGSFHSSQVSLTMSPTIHRGYRDIHLAERNDTYEPSVDKNGECQSHPGKPVNKSYRLRYDGSRYPVPEALKMLESGDTVAPLLNGVARPVVNGWYFGTGAELHFGTEA